MVVGIFLACILFRESMTSYVGCAYDHLHWPKQKFPTLITVTVPRM